MTTTHDRLRHFNYFDPADTADKWALFDHARSHAPVVRTDHEASGGPFYLLTRYDDVRRVMEDWETFSSTQSPLVATGVPSLSPIDDDPPFQGEVRKLLNPLFSRSALAPYEQAMHDTARSLIEEWLDDGQVEILNRYAGPYIGRMLIKVIFNDLTREELDVAQEIALEVAEAANPEVFARLFGICSEYLERAKRRGINGDGVLARLVNARIDGAPIPTEKQIGCLGILVLGGLDTTRAAIGNITYRLTQQPELEQRLRDPRWVRRDMDEFLRLDSPVGAMARVATRDVELNGVLIRKGERVQARFDAANRDPEKFTDPGSLHFDEARSGHAAFGMGVHRCLGSNMARMQIEIAFQELLARITRLRLAPGAEVAWAPGQSNCLHAVDIEFDRV
ncbi:cytochrome P450 [Nocardioides humi]|uniref:Cytochrome P450 n=1 Tax=Nocardioides humi TaxID=449461 RepID=A0ABN2AII7_9ACTN|nr:cytochrome P450 [Nocardioides humi]